MNAGPVPGAAQRHPLATIMEPRSVAVIGASEDQTKFGGRLYRTLLQHRYAGAVYPINPVRDELFGLRTWPSIESLPAAADMVVMALPRDKVKPAIAACASRGSKCAIIISSKFSDAGAEGAALEREVVSAASAHGMRLIGPNCLGIISPANRLVLCSSPALDVERLIEAPIGFVSQSGALMGTLFDRAHGMGIGFSHCVSVGNQADLELADFVEFFIDDPKTEIICSYVEGIKSPQRFVELARRARRAGKPWLMVKAGTTDDGSRAAWSHTASLAGDFAALAAVCREENVVLLDDPLDMLSLARAMVRYPRRRVRTVAIITTSGGGGAIAADRLSEAGIALARFEAETGDELATWYSEGQAANPVDIGGRRHESTEPIGVVTAGAVLADPGTDLALMVLTTAPDVPGLTQELIDGAATVRAAGKPTLYVMLPGRVAASARAMLIAAGLPYVDTLAEGVSVVGGWTRWSAYVEREAPQRPAGMAPTTTAIASSLGQTGCRSAAESAGDPEHRRVEPAGVFGERAAKALLAAAGVPVNREVVVGDVDEALARAAEVGYPLVLKVVSPDIAHKSDVGGVALGIDDADRLREALATMGTRIAMAAPAARIDGWSLQRQERGELELLIGARRDAQFGPQVLVGAGGVLVEWIRDVVVLPAPAAADSVSAALARLKVAPLLGPWRGRGALDVAAVVDAVVRTSWLAADLGVALPPGRGFELEINPLLVREAGGGVVVVDARARIDQVPPA